MPILVSYLRFSGNCVEIKAIALSSSSFSVDSSLYKLKSMSPFVSYSLREVPRYTIVDAPSILGLRPTGVEYLTEALKGCGLMRKLNAAYSGRVQPSLPYDQNRDHTTLLMNASAIRAFSIPLSEVVSAEIDRRRFPHSIGWGLQYHYRCSFRIKDACRKTWFIFHRRSF